MKEKIHPSYGPVSIQCACGNVIETRSTHQGVIHVDICSACHPFFTGQQKLVDTAGRIDRFKKKFGSRIALGRQTKPKKESVPQAPAKPASPSKSALQEKLQQAKEKIGQKSK